MSCVNVMNALNYLSVLAWCCVFIFFVFLLLLLCPQCDKIGKEKWIIYGICILSNKLYITARDVYSSSLIRNFSVEQ